MYFLVDIKHNSTDSSTFVGSTIGLLIPNELMGGRGILISLLNEKLIRKIIKTLSLF